MTKCPQCHTYLSVYDHYVTKKWGRVTRTMCRKCGFTEKCYERSRLLPSPQVLEAFAVYFLVHSLNLVERFCGISAETVRANLIRYLLREDSQAKIYKILRDHYRVPEELLFDVIHCLPTLLKSRNGLHNLWSGHCKLVRHQSRWEKLKVARKLEFILKKKVKVSQRGKFSVCSI